MRHVDPRLAELSRTMPASELGRRVRAARVAAGMTQAEIAGGEVTAAHVSRIESGQRRPEIRLLTHLAGRMGITLHELLTDQRVDDLRQLELMIDHAELALAGGDAPAALEQASAALGRLPGTGTPQWLAAKRVQAGAFEAHGDLSAAIAVLEEVTATPTADANWLRSLIALSRCYRDAGDFARAIAVGEKAGATIAQLGIEGLTEAIQLTVTVAAAYHRLGDTDQAMRTCLRALAAAERFDSPIAKASAYWNASTIETATNGATPAAVDMAKRALALFELGEDNRNLAKIRAEVATLQLAENPPDPRGALGTLDTAERELRWSGASAWEMALVHITRGRAHLMLGEYDEALASVDRGSEIAPAQAPFLLATSDAVRGQVAVREGRLDDARACYRRAILVLSGAGVDRGAAQLWFELADLLAEVGDTEGALQAFRSAGASSGLRVTPSSLTGARPSTP